MMKCTAAAKAIACLASAALVLSACSGDTDDEERKTLRLALNQSESHPSYIALDDFGTYLEENTDGWTIDVYANTTLGNQPEAMQLTQDGSVDMVIVSGAYLESYNEDFILFNLPRVFDDVEHQMEVLHDPEITGDLFSSLEQGYNLTVLGGFTQGARSIFTTDGHIETPADMAGKKLRVQESAVNIAMAEALGASASPLATSELYTGLQAGVVDAAENNEPFYVTQNLYEVAPYWSYTNHLVGVDYLLINTDILESMSDADREVFMAGWERAHQEHTEMWAEATDEAIATAEAGGASFAEVDHDAFNDALTAMADRFITTESQRTLFNKVREAAK